MEVKVRKIRAAVKINYGSIIIQGVGLNPSFTDRLFPFTIILSLMRSSLTQEKLISSIAQSYALG